MVSFAMGTSAKAVRVVVRKNVMLAAIRKRVTAIVRLSRAVRGILI
jgi:hypothetical protein